MKEIDSDDVLKEFEKRLETVKDTSDYQELRTWLKNQSEVPKEKEEAVQPNPLQMRASNFEEVGLELTNLIKSNKDLQRLLYIMWQLIIDDEKKTQKMSDLNLWNDIQNLSDLTLLQKQYLEFKLIQYLKEYPIEFKTKWDSIKKAVKDFKESNKEWYLVYFALNDMEMTLKKGQTINNDDLENKKEHLKNLDEQGARKLKTRPQRMGEAWQKIENSKGSLYRKSFAKFQLLKIWNSRANTWNTSLLLLEKNLDNIESDEWLKKPLLQLTKEHISTLEEIEFHPDYRLSEDEYHWDKIYSEIIEPMCHVASQYSEQTENIDAFRRLGVYPLVRVDQEQDSMPLVFQTKYLHTLSVLGHMLHQMEQQQPIDEELIVRADAEWPDRL